MATAREITIIEPEGTDRWPLCVLGEQGQPYPAWVELGSHKTDTPTLQSYWERGDAPPIRIWKGDAWRWVIPARIERDDLVKMMQKLCPIMSAWLAETAQTRVNSKCVALYKQIEALIMKCQPDKMQSPILARNWLSDVAPDEWGVTAQSSDDKLEQIAKKIEDDALDVDVQLQDTLEHKIGRASCRERV